MIKVERYRVKERFKDTGKEKGLKIQVMTDEKGLKIQGMRKFDLYASKASSKGTPSPLLYRLLMLCSRTFTITGFINHCHL